MDKLPPIAIDGEDEEEDVVSSSVLLFRLSSSSFCACNGFIVCDCERGTETPLLVDDSPSLLVLAAADIISSAASHQQRWRVFMAMIYGGYGAVVER